jgi:uncharacterized membrane protein YjjP (DUF1212 family)
MATNEWGIEIARRLPERTALDKAQRERRRALIFPREHGAWGLLLVPLVTGAGVALRSGGRILPLLLLLTAALALFWLRTPLESWLGTSAMRAQTKEERLTVGIVTLALGKIAVVALAALLWAGRNRELWLIGAIAGAAFVAQGFIKRAGRRGRTLSEMVGAIGLTSSAAAAYYLVTGRLDATAWMLWLTNLVCAGNQIHYVQLRIHAARIEGLRAKLVHGWIFAAGQAVMIIALTLACVFGLMPRFASLAFAPLLFRGWFYFIEKPAPLLVRRLGWSELGHACAFCGLLVAAFAIA